MDEPRKGYCAGCLAFEAMSSTCRRRSPVVFPVPRPSSVPGQVEVATMGLFPATSKGGWCLDFIEDPRRDEEVSQ